MVHGKQLAWSLESNEYSKMVASLSASFKKLRMLRLTEVKFFSPSHIVSGQAITPQPHKAASCKTRERLLEKAT